MQWWIDFTQICYLVKSTNLLVVNNFWFRWSLLANMVFMYTYLVPKKWLWLWLYRLQKGRWNILPVFAKFDEGVQILSFLLAISYVYWSGSLFDGARGDVPLDNQQLWIKFCRQHFQWNSFNLPDIPWRWMEVEESRWRLCTGKPNIKLGTRQSHLSVRSEQSLIVRCDLVRW